MDIGTMTTSSLTLGLKPRVTGLPWNIYLHQSPSIDANLYFEVSKSVGGEVSRKSYLESPLLRFMIEPTFMQLSGAPLDFRESEALEHWVALNGDLIEGYWDRSMSGDVVYRGIKKIKSQW
ncbi:MAG: hypothetical protein ACLGIM_16305 [Alphaproteobacteria bacterium]